MKKENYKISKRSSSHYPNYPNIKISLNTMNNFDKDKNKNTDESHIDLNESEDKHKRKKVRFLTNELHIKEDYKLGKLSPPKTLLKNSILKKSSSKNSRIDSFFKKLAQQHKFIVINAKNKNNNNSNLLNDKNSKKDDLNSIPVIEPNKKDYKSYIDYSECNLNEITKENNKHIFYPLLNNNKSKNKNLSFDYNIKNKFHFKNNLKTKKNNINFFQI